MHLIAIMCLITRFPYTTPGDNPYKFTMSSQAEDTSSFQGIVRGHHINKSIWTPWLGEQLILCTETGNKHDKYTVSIFKKKTIVGHIPCLQIVWHLSTEARRLVKSQEKECLEMDLKCLVYFIDSMGPRS